MNLTFYDKKINIPEEFKITFWRFNDGTSSPISPTAPVDFGNIEWDFEADSVSADGAGFYCVPEEQVLMLNNSFIQTACVNVEEPVFLKIEADRRDILYAGFDEFAISRGNIVEVLHRHDFWDRFPMYRVFYTIIADKAGGLLGSFLYSLNLAKHSRQIERFSGGVFGHADGFPHSVRVEKGIRILGGYSKIPSNELAKITDFAYWHDVMRASGVPDPDHAKRAAEAVTRCRPCLRMERTDRGLLAFACEHHSTMLRSGDPLIDICFDADRLDLSFRGITPEPSMMATEIGKYYAENHGEYLAAINNTSIDMIRHY
jgi:uncharacterized protein